MTYYVSGSLQKPSVTSAHLEKLPQGMPPMLLEDERDSKCFQDYSYENFQIQVSCQYTTSNEFPKIEMTPEDASEREGVYFQY